MNAVDSNNLNARHAVIYDALADEYDARADALLQVTQESIGRLLAFVEPDGSTALDVGCGVGVTTKVLADAGYAVTALDISARMVEACLVRTPGARVMIGDYLGTVLAEPFDVIVAFAYIHLFPADLAAQHLRKMRADLTPNGRLLIGSTQEQVSSEGFEGKADYAGAPRRFRKRWTEDEFRGALANADFDLLDLTLHHDPFGKCWMDAIVTPKP